MDSLYESFADEVARWAKVDCEFTAAVELPLAADGWQALDMPMATGRSKEAWQNGHAVPARRARAQPAPPRPTTLAPAPATPVLFPPELLGLRAPSPTPVPATGGGGGGRKRRSAAAKARSAQRPRRHEREAGLSSA